MKVIGVDKDGKFSSGNELNVGDLFVVDIDLVEDDTLAEWILSRGLEIPLVVESIDEDNHTVKPKSGDYSIHRIYVIKKI